MDKNLQKKIRILDKLKNIGCTDKQKLLNLDIKDLITKIEPLTISDLKMILEIKEIVKNNSLYSYLCADNEKETEEK